MSFPLLSKEGKRIVKAVISNAGEKVPESPEKSNKLPPIHRQPKYYFLEVNQWETTNSVDFTDPKLRPKKDSLIQSADRVVRAEHHYQWESETHHSLEAPRKYLQQMKGRYNGLDNAYTRKKKRKHYKLKSLAELGTDK